MPLTIPNKWQKLFAAYSEQQQRRQAFASWFNKSILDVCAQLHKQLGAVVRSTRDPKLVLLICLLCSQHAHAFPGALWQSLQTRCIAYLISQSQLHEQMLTLAFILKALPYFGVNLASLFLLDPRSAVVFVRETNLHKQPDENNI